MDKIFILDKSLNQGFTQIPNIVLRSSKLSFGAKVLYGILLSYAWSKDNCFPKQGKLAEDMGVKDRKTVKKYLDELRQRKLINWQKEDIGASNTYYILSLHEFELQNELEEKAKKDKEVKLNKGKISSINEGQISSSIEEALPHQLGTNILINRGSSSLSIADKHPHQIGTNIPTNNIHNNNTHIKDDVVVDEYKNNIENNTSTTTTNFKNGFLEVKKVFEKNIRPITPIEAELISYWLEDLNLEYEVVIEAIREAVKSNARAMKYIEKIILSWHSKGFKTIDAVKGHLRDYQDKKAGVAVNKHKNIVNEDIDMNMKQSEEVVVDDELLKNIQDVLEYSEEEIERIKGANNHGSTSFENKSKLDEFTKKFGKL